MVEAERRKRSGSVTKVQQDTGIPRTAPRYKLGLSSESSSDRKRVLDIGERRNLRSANVRSGEPSFTKSTAASPAEMTSRKSKETSKIGFRTQLSSKVSPSITFTHFKISRMLGGHPGDGQVTRLELPHSGRSNASKDMLYIALHFTLPSAPPSSPAVTSTHITALGPVSRERGSRSWLR